MKYNKIHKQYRLGLGLWFSLEYGHANCPGKWMAKSNIPEIDFLQLESSNQEDAVYEVMGIIQSRLDFEYTDETVKASLPKKLPRIIAGEIITESWQQDPGDEQLIKQ